MTSERLNPVKRLNLERIIFITFYPFQSLSSLVGISGLILRLYPFFSFLLMAPPHAILEFSHTGARVPVENNTHRLYIRSTISSYLNDGTSYSTASVHAVMPFKISKLITVTI